MNKRRTCRDAGERTLREGPSPIFSAAPAAAAFPALFAPFALLVVFAWFAAHGAAWAAAAGEPDGAPREPDASLAVRAAGVAVSPSRLALRVGREVPPGTKLDVTGGTEISALTIKKAGESGGGDASSEWNGLNLSVSPANGVSLAGSPEAAGERTFVLTSTSARGAATGTFTVTAVWADGSVSFAPGPAIFDAKGGRARRMTTGERMRLLFRAEARLSGVSVLAEGPGGAPSPLPEGAAGDGYIAYHPTPEATGVTVYYTPPGNGSYAFRISYSHGGERRVERFSVAAAPARLRSGGGCDSGFGAAPLSALGGLALLRGRGRRRAGAVSAAGPLPPAA